MKRKISLKINGKTYSHEVEPRLLLIHYLREVAGLTGPHIGCETSICGACTVAIDGKDKWLIHNHLASNETDFDSVDRDWALRAILGVDDRFQYEVLSKEDWIGRRLLADRFRDRRVFICGTRARVSAMTEFKLISTTLSQVASSIASIG